MSGATKPKFNLIAEEDPPAAKPDPALVSHNATMLMLALRALSQRSLTAITNLFSLILVGAVFALAWVTLPNPGNSQLIELCGFAVFCLLIDIVRRRS
jgi:hypothetical protein